MFANALLAEAAAEEIPDDRRIFAPLIGSWSLSVEWLDEHGDVVRQSDGEWHFHWILEGRAVQDVWIVPPRGKRDSDADYLEYGTSIRFYDQSIDAWRSLWIGPMQRLMRRFIAHAEDDRITLMGDDEAIHQWVFSSIRTESFLWCNQVPSDGGWRSIQRFSATRVGSA